MYSIVENFSILNFSVFPFFTCFLHHCFFPSSSLSSSPFAVLTRKYLKKLSSFRAKAWQCRRQQQQHEKYAYYFYRISSVCWDGIHPFRSLRHHISTNKTRKKGRKCRMTTVDTIHITELFRVLFGLAEECGQKRDDLSARKRGEKSIWRDVDWEILSNVTTFTTITQLTTAHKKKKGQTTLQMQFCNTKNSIWNVNALCMN